MDIYFDYVLGCLLLLFMVGVIFFSFREPYSAKKKDKSLFVVPDIKKRFIQTKKLWLISTQQS